MDLRSRGSQYGIYCCDEHRREAGRRQKRSSLVRSEAPTNLYMIVSEESGHIKLGRAVDPERRLDALQGGNPEPLRLVGHIPSKVRRERQMHDAADRLAHRARGEWYRYSKTLAVMVHGIIASEGVLSKWGGSEFYSWLRSEEGLTRSVNVGHVVR